MDNKMHLIDANKLMVCHINVGTVMFPKMEAFVRAEDIKAAPIVDAEPVVHGYWKQNPNMPTQYSCSICRRHIEDMMCNPNKYFPYCHCGAKMDLKERKS